MAKLKLPIIIVLVLAALGAGLFVSGVIGGKEPSKTKKPVTPVVLVGTDPNGFTLNTADGDRSGFVVFNLALEPAPMTAEELALWEGAGGGGHGGGSSEPPGPKALSTYPKYRDAVIAVTTRFTSEQLLAKDGQELLKEALLAKFDEIAQRDEAAYGAPKKGEVHDPTHPPFHVHEVYLQNFAVQVNE